MSEELPNLSQGHAGVIGFQQVNRVFRAVEEFEKRPNVPKAPRPEPRGFPLLAKLLVKTGTVWNIAGYETWTWAEVKADISGIDWSLINNGITSALLDDAERLCVTPPGVAANDIVHLWPMPSMRGYAVLEGPAENVRPWYLAHPLKAGGSGGAVGRIASVIASIAEIGGRRGYTVNMATGGTYLAPTITVVMAYNAFELNDLMWAQIEDETPGTKTLLPLPLGERTGPLVKTPFTAIDVGGTGLPVPLYEFNMPNAIGVVC